MVAKIRVSLARRNASKREKLVTGFVIMSAMVFFWIGGTSGALEPNLTSVEAWGETQIKVTWQPFDYVDSDKPHFYELYIDDYLEYFGNDVIYIARRLTPDTVYHFKLRSCVQDSSICSTFSKTLSGTTAQSGKRGFYTKSFIQWTILITILASTTALIGAKITKRLWRSFLYRYDYRSETNLQLPKYAASTDTIDEDVMSSLCLKNLPNTEGSRELTELVCNAFDETHGKLSESILKNDILNESSCLEEKRKCSIVALTEGSSESVLNTDSPSTGNCELFIKHENKHLKEEIEEIHLREKNEKIAKSLCKNTAKNFETLTIQRAHTSPKIQITKDFDSKRKKKGNHRRALSFDSNILNKNRNEILKSHNPKPTKHDIQDTCVHSTDLVIVVDNSNIFIGAQECASLLNSNERKRHIRVKIQQLVKVFQRGRAVSRAFVQGSSPPTTEQVWEVYRRLGYCVDVEDRRGRDEQRVDEGLHLHIYKALFELSPRTLIIASGDGNKGKSECATSLPGCAQAALERGWKVEIHSWQHSTSMEWSKLSKKYPELLSIHYLDRYLNYITFMDGKYGRKCQPFPADVFKQ